MLWWTLPLVGICYVFGMGLAYPRLQGAAANSYFTVIMPQQLALHLGILLWQLLPVTHGLLAQWSRKPTVRSDSIL
jgi:hypothetical protein